MRWCFLAGSFCIVLLLAHSHAPAGDKDKKEAKQESFLMVVPPVGGKEVKLVDWRFTLGTRHFSLSDEKSKSKDKGPEYLEFREEKSTTYRNGILTLIPLTSVKKIDFDKEKKSVTCVALDSAGEPVTLTGSTKFTGSNKLTIEAEAVLEGLGNATVKFHGGLDKGGLQSVSFPNPKAGAKQPEGPVGVVTADDKEKSKHVAHDLQPLYLVEGQYRIVPYVMFKKTVKVDMEKLAGFRYMPPEDKKKASNDYEVTLKDGTKHVLSLITTVESEKKKMTFVGLLGRVPVGYRLFAVDAIYEFKAGEPEKK